MEKVIQKPRSKHSGKLHVCWPMLRYRLLGGNVGGRYVCQIGKKLLSIFNLDGTILVAPKVWI